MEATSIECRRDQTLTLLLLSKPGSKQVSNRGMEASKRDVEASKKRAWESLGMEASKRGVGASKKRALGGSDDRTKLAIKAIIEVTKVAEQVSERGIEASKRGIEEATKHPGL